MSCHDPPRRQAENVTKAEQKRSDLAFGTSQDKQVEAVANGKQEAARRCSRRDMVCNWSYWCKLSECYRQCFMQEKVRGMYSSSSTKELAAIS